MEQIATVKRVNGKLAEIEVSRKAMCDGCHKTECGSGCAMSSLFSAGKSMRANAVNKIGAMPGDTVEVETSDKSVLLMAILVFILPIVFGGLFYSVARYGISLSGDISVIAAIIGFALPFVFVKAIDIRQKNKEPVIIIKRILNDRDNSADDAC